MLSLFLLLLLSSLYLICVVIVVIVVVVSIIIELVDLLSMCECGVGDFLSLYEKVEEVFDNYFSVLKK